MEVRFDFEYVGKNTFGSIFRPIAKVSLQALADNRWIETWMIVDSGADFTILPRYLAHELHISLEKDCHTDITQGVGGKQTIYLLKKKITAKIGSLAREIPLAFFSSDELPALLGRLGFMETFDVELLKKHSVIFK